MELRNLELKHLDFDRQMLHVVLGKGGKDRYVPLSEHLIRGIKTNISAAQPKKYLFENTACKTEDHRDFDGRYSQRGVQWIVKAIAKEVGIRKNVHVHTLRHTYANT